MDRDVRVQHGKKSLGPIENLFLFMERKTPVEIWTEHNPNLGFQGVISGFDEWMNLTLENTKEINTKKGTVENLGKIILKGDTLSVIHLLKREDLK